MLVSLAVVLTTGSAQVELSFARTPWARTQVSVTSQGGNYFRYLPSIVIVIKVETKKLEHRQRLCLPHSAPDLTAV